MGLVLAAPARAATITLAAGVMNPPPSLMSTGLTPPQLAVADTARLIPVAQFTGVLQSTLNAQGFTAANNWTLVNNLLTLANNATFNITQYNLFLNGAGTAFGEDMDFTLNPNLTGPVVPAGSTATLHWLQVLNEDKQYNGFGFAIAGQQGFWQVDNGDVNGGPAAGAGTGPYYDSNSAGGFSVPPGFHDAPQFYAGVGTYLHFETSPAWDVFTPAGGGKPAMESIDVADFGLAWGFTIVPEPSTSVLMIVGLALSGVFARLRRARTR
jgi:hypothetical protein